jgi:hypothetical protein
MTLYSERGRWAKAEKTPGARPGDVWQSIRQFKQT